MQRARGNRELNIAILSFLMMMIMGTGVLSWIQFHENGEDQQKIMINEKNLLDIEEKMIHKNLDVMLSDLTYIVYTYESTERTLDASDLDSISAQWARFLDSKKIYYKMRLIAPDGAELIRVNYAKAGSYASASDQLVNLEDRYYLQDAVLLNRNIIYISQLDLEYQNGMIGYPLKPTVRLATPVFHTDGSMQALIVLSYDANQLISELHEIESGSDGDFLLLNEAGYWLFDGTKKSREWGFLLPGKETDRFSALYPERWRLFQGKLGSFTDERGYVTYRRINLHEHAAMIGTTDRPWKVIGEETQWVLATEIEATSEAGRLFSQNPMELIVDSIRKNLFGYMTLVVSAFAAALLIVAFLRSKEKVQSFSVDSLTGAYHRRAGFELLEKAYESARKMRKELSICFCDVNGLKKVNDTLGHEAGDDLIRDMMKGMRSVLSARDFVIRIGGDEFLIVFIDCDRSAAEHKWVLIVAEFDRMNFTNDRPFLISVSHGIEAFGFEAEESLYSIINAADEKMYREKKAHWSRHERGGA